jgi:hypothetical protein
MVETSLAARPPKPLHLSTRFGVIRPGVHQANAEARASDAQHLAAISRTIVKKEHVASAMQAKGSSQYAQHVFLALARVCLQRNDVARAIIEQAVDA